MKAKAFKRERKRWRKHYGWWVHHLGLGDWEIKRLYYDKPFKKQRKGRFTIADCTVDWEYKLATIRANLALLRGRSDTEVEKIVVHELMHVKLNEMRHYGASDGIYHEERTATELTSAFIWVRDGAKEGT